VKVTINGEEYNFKQGFSVDQLLLELKIDAEKIAFEQNLAIVPLSEYKNTTINEGDNIEIVQFMGGG